MRKTRKYLQEEPIPGAVALKWWALTPDPAQWNIPRETDAPGYSCQLRSKSVEMLNAATLQPHLESPTSAGFSYSRHHPCNWGGRGAERKIAHLRKLRNRNKLAELQVLIITRLALPQPTRGH